jgi:indole-3-glycerol phosphate synthase
MKCVSRNTCIQTTLYIHTVGGHYYESGASAICVCVDAECYGFTHNDLEIVHKGQQSHKNDFPGPLPCIAYDYILDPVQIAYAAEKGAQGVVLNAAALKERCVRACVYVHMFKLALSV